jgi:hypothetical protein
LIVNISLKDVDKVIRISQIKEKFGTLRCYIDFGTDEIYKMIDEFEKKSTSICEICGNKGRFRKGGWCRVLCDKCEEERTK